MDSEEFREFGKATVDLIADYIENIRERPVLPDVEKGYLQNLLPNEAPQQGQEWKEVLSDIQNIIMPGLTHWQSPMFNAYFPTGSSFPSIIGEMLSAAFGTIGFSWMSCPPCTELEVISLNWLGKLIGLPQEFLNSSEGPGGGVIQGSASESTLVALLVSKDKMINRLKLENPGIDELLLQSKLVAYSSDESNSSVEKSGKLSSTKLKLLKTDRNGKLRAETLLKAIKKDRESGLIPYCVVATLGTTGTCAFDPLDEIGPICNNENVWLHVDAAYAGAAAICPEHRYIMEGVKYADSFNFNAHKWLLVNFDLSAMWVKDAKDLVNAFNVDRIYIKNDELYENQQVPEYRHWQIPLGRRFRALKLWITMRIYGKEGLQNHIRNHCELAKFFESLVLKDERFEIVIPATLGLVGFRIKGDNQINKDLLEILTASKELYLVATQFKENFTLRYVICSQFTKKSDVERAWNIISSKTAEILRKKNVKKISR